jgi:Na+-transporting NADH:ubiquinone oxidoreductase subunit NqrB
VHLEEFEFHGKENRKFQYAVLCSASLAGGLQPDLLEEVVWWGTDGFWRYALLATVALIRASAAACQVSVEDVVAELALRRSVKV